MLGYLKLIWELTKEWRATKRSPVTRTNYLNDVMIRGRTNIIIDDPQSLKAKFHLTDEMIINLAGGLPTDDFIAAEFQATSQPGDVIKTTLFYEFGMNSKGQTLSGRIDRTLDLRDRVIHNDVMFIQKQGTGIGTNLFINQLTEAIALSFSTIEVTAAGPDTTPPPFFPFKWDGYKTWIKFGYLMVPDDDSRYKAWSISRTFTEDTLNKLYFQKVNYKEWEDYGFTWEGIIELKKSRTSVLLFKLYLLKKNINVPLSEIVLPEFPALLAHRISLSKKK